MNELTRRLVVWLIGEPKLPHVFNDEIPVPFCRMCNRRQDDPSLNDRHIYCYGPYEWNDYLRRLQKPL